MACAALAVDSKNSTSTPPLPQIGVLCIDVSHSIWDTLKSFDVRSYIPASYVKFLKSAGADSVPIWIGRKRDYYEKLLCKLNGVLIPGGAVFFESDQNSTFPNDCVESSKYIYEIAKELNEQGHYFPIWGTCLGFQLMLYHAAIGEQKHEVRCDCKPMDYSLPISFESGFQASKLFTNLDAKMKRAMETEAFGYHYHRFGVTRQALSRFQLDQDWHILATNKDSDGFEFITFIEHKSFPFYGAQVHLERVAHEILKPDVIDACNHSENSIKVAEYFSNFFISECLKCAQKFDSNEERLRYSINNFEIMQTDHTHWLECYLFGAANDYVNA